MTLNLNSIHVTESRRLVPQRSQLLRSDGCSRTICDLLRTLTIGRSISKNKNTGRNYARYHETKYKAMSEEITWLVALAVEIGCHRLKYMLVICRTEIESENALTPPRLPTPICKAIPAPRFHGPARLFDSHVTTQGNAG